MTENDLALTVKRPCGHCHGLKEVPNPGWMKAHRQALGVKISDIAKEIGVSYHYLYYLEQGRTVCPDWLLNHYQRLEAGCT